MYQRVRDFDRGIGFRACSRPDARDPANAMNGLGLALTFDLDGAATKCEANIVELSIDIIAGNGPRVAIGDRSVASTSNLLSADGNHHTRDPLIGGK